MTLLCKLDDIPMGGSKGVMPNERGRDQVVLVRQGHRVYGYVNNCPHYDKAPLGWKKDAFLDGDGQHIMCASHGALFRISDGECVIGPCLGRGLKPVRLIIQGGDVRLDDTA
jgi:nitrite reductase/ring-hydroxylating ferredoxin subunit